MLFNDCSKINQILLFYFKEKQHLLLQIYPPKLNIFYDAYSKYVLFTK